MKIDPGEIVLIPKCEPPLAADTYEVSLKQTLSQGERAGESVPLGLPGKATQKIKVDGPRFILTPDEVHSMFPPVNNLGNFANRLPQIVLRRRTLPWERKIPSVSSPDAPWMALLLVSEEEEEDGLVTFHPQKLVSELVQSEAISLYCPDPHILLLSDDEKSKSCMMVDIDGGLFSMICPTPKEMGLLSHVRVVSTEDKELLGQDEDGWFSVVTCNRLPVQGELEKHRALLVSLEGHAGHMFTIGGRPRRGRIRMAVLAQWQFTSKSTGDFKTTLTNIGRSGGVGLLGDGRDNCVPVDEDSTDRNTLVIETAHVPLNQSYRTGEKGVGLYRGPLTPAPISHETMVCNHVDETMIIDPTTGLEQIGYSAAFELGRLLGASDERLAVGLLKWRRGDYSDAQGLANVKDIVIREDWRREIDFSMRMEHVHIIEELRNPFGPLVNPNPEHGYFSNQSHYIDQGGMSQRFMAEMGNKMNDEIVSFGLMDMGDVAAGLDNVGDITTPHAGGREQLGRDVNISTAEIKDQLAVMGTQHRDELIIQSKEMAKKEMRVGKEMRPGREMRGDNKR